jgi:hypothetical protein
MGGGVPPLGGGLVWHGVQGEGRDAISEWDSQILQQCSMLRRVDLSGEKFRKKQGTLVQAQHMQPTAWMAPTKMTDNGTPLIKYP